VPTEEARLNWLPKIRSAISCGMTICAVAQTLYGRLNPNVYSGGRKLKKTGVIFLEDMLPEAALVKLGWVLGHRKWKDKIREKMLENVCGEISRCSRILE
ncbi:hypothetical protein D6829_02410, partial [Candidatus Pacearchaeota archaeon]